MEKKRKMWFGIGCVLFLVSLPFVADPILTMISNQSESFIILFPIGYPMLTFILGFGFMIMFSPLKQKKADGQGNVHR
ncbi:hypothetical protein H0266_02550 [Halobacillus locisalis]|uniref:Uncharacterized protein n=1 Tax=Halobacillus locisalis TaxID=220753 RepID=A0A838CP47_9BACI|nr:hypothetical protein [Halobacillus locisalis]MBA2173770.1 hypothetical protein [Halobacillus locisalis]